MPMLILGNGTESFSDEGGATRASGILLPQESAAGLVSSKRPKDSLYTM